jgi:hypothetical protein
MADSLNNSFAPGLASAPLNLLQLVDDLATVGALFDGAELAACEACADPSDRNAIMAVMGVAKDKMRAIVARIDQARGAPQG